MLYCTKCESICEDSTQTCPNCKRSRGLRPVKPEDEVFFLKVSEGEAAELALLFEQNAVRHAIHPVKGGFSTSVYDPEYLPTDKDIYVLQTKTSNAPQRADAQRAGRAVAGKNVRTGRYMPRGKRMLIQSLSVIAFMAIVILVVLGSDFIANLLKALFTK